MNECQGKAESATLRADTKEEMLADVDFPAEIAEAERVKVNCDKTVIDLHAEGKALAARVERMEADAAKLAEKRRLEGEIASAETRLNELLGISGKLASNRLKLKADDESVAANANAEAIKKNNAFKQSEYDLAVQKWESSQRTVKEIAELRERVTEAETLAADLDALREIKESVTAYNEAQQDITRLNAEIEAKRLRITALDNPCEHCGKLASDAAGQIGKLNADIASIEAAVKTMRAVPAPGGQAIDIDRRVLIAEEAARSLDGLRGKLAMLESEPITERPDVPAYEAVPDYVPVLDIFTRKSIEDAVKAAESADAEASALERTIADKRVAVAGIIVSDDAADRLAVERSRLDDMRREFTDAQVMLNQRINELNVLIADRDRDAALRAEVEALRAEAKATGWTHGSISRDARGK